MPNKDHDKNLLRFTYDSIIYPKNNLFSYISLLLKIDQVGYYQEAIQFKIVI